MIEICDVQKRFNSHVAVDGLSFEVRKGETFGLLGPNGAGKTTTLHMIAGVLRPDGGTIHLDGSADPTLPEVRRRLGIAPQANALYENLSGEENVAFIARMYGLRSSGLSTAVDRALALVGLTDRRTDRAAGYSGGMKRRLNLACALVHDPPVLLLDEPTAGVDPQSRNHLLDSIAELARQGRTVLYTTHYMEEAQKLCHRVGIVDHGKLLALDTVENLVANHGGRSVVEVEVDGETERRRFDSEDPLNDLTALAAKGAKVRSFRVDRPDLETVFLNLTGRRLRD